jgi:uncharacterized protein DUF6680
MRHLRRDERVQLSVGAMNPTSEVFGSSILFATFLGPVAAVLVTRYVDLVREKTARRLSIFRTLMATRRTVISPEHIAALNQVELDFHKDAGVMSAFRQYMRHLSTPFDPKENDRITRERQSLRTKLLSEMAKSLHIRVEQLDIFEGGYVPQGHVDVEREQAVIRRLFSEIADGKRSLPIEIRTGSPAEDPEQSQLLLTPRAQHPQ